MRKRVVFGSLLMSVLAALLAIDHVLGIRAAISSLIFVVGLLGFCELSVMGGIASRSRGGGVPLFLLGIAGTAYFLALGWWNAPEGTERSLLLAAGAAVLVPLAFATVIFRADHREGFQPLLATLLGVFLCGFFFSYLLRIYQHPDRTWVGLFFLLGIKGNDIAAYFVGMTMGHTHYLHVSPRKTLEGSLGALAFSVLWFGAGGALWPEALFPWPLGILLGIILSVASQVGDLSESLIKRYYAVKDSGVLLPELGGILDLIDSFLYCGFIFWAFLRN